MTIVDASVAVKWVVKETGSPEALAFLQQASELAAPDIILLEVASALAKQTHIGRFTAEGAQQRLTRMRSIIDQAPVTLYPPARLLGAALILSASLRHPLADCVYVALAQELGSPIITADRKLAAIAETALGAERVLRLNP